MSTTATHKPAVFYRGKAPPDTALEKWATKKQATFTVGHNLLRSRGLRLAPGCVFAGSAHKGIVADVVDHATGEARGRRVIRLRGSKWEVVKG